MDTQEYAHDWLLELAETCSAIIKKTGQTPTYTILDYDKKTVLWQSPGIKSVIKFSDGGAWFPGDSCGGCFRLADLIEDWHSN